MTGSKKRWALLAVSVAVMVSVAAIFVASNASRETGATISITIAGLVYSPTSEPLANLKARQSVTVTAELICVSGISSGIHTWTGVKLKSLLTEAGVQASAIKVAFTSSDHYTTDLNLSDAMRDDVIIAYLQDGSAMTEKTRLVVPGKWGYKWISDLVKIELVDFNFLGKWEQRGYSDDATIP